MGISEFNHNIDQSARNAEINSAPLGNAAMIDQSFNKTFGLTQSKDQIPFLPSSDELLSQFPLELTNKFTYQSYRQDQGLKQHTYQALKQNTEEAPKTTDQAQKQTTDQAQKQPSDATGERPAQKFPRGEENNITVGALEYGLDEDGYPISITGPRNEYFYKGSDGKWVEHMPPSSERTVENFTFDAEGNMEFDVVSKGYVAHHKRNADGSHSIDSKEYGGKLVYDKEGNLVEAPAGNGHPPRKFHYDKDGKLDQIDGRLGHWQREVKDGKETWVNTTTKARWEGEMRVNPKTNELEFRGRNGANWNFTTTGKDIPATAKS